MIGIKISKVMAIISHFKLIYQQRILFTLYNSLIISHMLYGILLWGKSNNVHTIEKLQKQDAREAMRVVFFCTCKTYLYMYAQNKICHEYIQILF